MPGKNLVVIGGGAAGFFCAVNAASMNPGLRVIIIEKSGKLLSKVRVSGGGRCNVTHACFDITEMSRKYPRGYNFVKKSFHQFFTTDTIEWFGARGVALKEEKDGRMFPVTDSSQSIIDCLLGEASRLGITILMNRDARSIDLKNGKFLIDVGNEKLSSDLLCVASGGYPKPGMFEWLTATGHSIETPVPSLFTFNIPAHPIRELMGVAVENVVVKIQGTKFEQQGPLLITHWGVSGPAVLRISAYAARELNAMNYDFIVHVSWVPGYSEQTLAERVKVLRVETASQKVYNRNAFQLPSRLWEFLLQEAGIKEDVRWADLPAREANKLVSLLCRYEFHVKGKTTFKEEFVTSGGIRLQEIDANTMMSKRVSGLYFAGEVMDVDGITGGFNFQHAWTSGFIAAKHIASIVAADQ